MSTATAAAILFALGAVYSWQTKRGLGKFAYAGGLGLIAATLVYPDTPRFLGDVVSGAALSGAGATLITAACVIGAPLVGLWYICNLPRRR